MSFYLLESILDKWFYLEEYVCGKYFMDLFIKYFFLNVLFRNKPFLITYNSLTISHTKFIRLLYLNM